MKNTNKNNITELVFILDRSGSMSRLESDTIGGFNSMIAKQKKQDGGCCKKYIGYICVNALVYPPLAVRWLSTKLLTNKAMSILHHKLATISILKKKLLWIFSGE